MAKKIFRQSIRVTRHPVKDRSWVYKKISEDTFQGTVLTVFVGPGGMPILVIDNDPGQSYTIEPRDIIETLATVGIKEKIKEERKHANTRRD